MPLPFPHHYNVSLEWLVDRNAKITTREGLAIEGAPPIEFDGPGHQWSPEELLLSAIGLCFITTFCSMAHKENLSFHSFACKVDGTLEKTKEGLNFTQYKIHSSISSQLADREKTSALLAKAKKYCIVGNALKIEPTLEINFL